MSEVSHCPYCGKCENRSLYHFNDINGNHWKLNICSNCSTHFLSPRPSEEELSRAYDSSYYGAGESKFKGPYERVVDYFRKKRARSLARAIGSQGRILDIGCGNGRFLEHLSKCGEFELIGSEKGEGALERARRIKGITLIDEDLSLRLPENIGQFDAISCYHVFEHLLDPVTFLNHLVLLSKEGTVLEVSFPNIRSLQARLFKGRWLHLDPPRHLHHMPPKSFIKELELKGFKLLQYSSLSLEQNPFGCAQSVLNVVLKDRDVLLERLKGNEEYASQHGKYSMLMQKAAIAIMLPFAALADVAISPWRLGATVTMRFRRIEQ